MTQLQTGTIVRIWHGTRGHDWVVACIDTQSKQIGLVKNNCINNDGSIHRALVEQANYANRLKWIGYQNLGDEKITPKVNRIIGTRELNREHIASFVLASAPNSRAVRKSDKVKAGIDPAMDNRTAVAY